MSYGFTGWEEGEECQPPEPNKIWLSVGPLGHRGEVEEELCVLVIRTDASIFEDLSKLELAKWDRLRDAQLIVDALNAYEPPAEDAEEEPAPHVSKQPSIRRKFLGGVEEQGFVDFANSTIQDSQMALEVAQRMLDGDQPYPWNEEDSRFYEEFEIIDATLLREQMARVSS